MSENGLVGYEEEDIQEEYVLADVAGQIIIAVGLECLDSKSSERIDDEAICSVICGLHDAGGPCGTLLSTFIDQDADDEDEIPQEGVNLHFKNLRMTIAAGMEKVASGLNMDILNKKGLRRFIEKVLKDNPKANTTRGREVFLYSIFCLLHATEATPMGGMMKGAVLMKNVMADSVAALPVDRNTLKKLEAMFDDEDEDGEEFSIEALLESTLFDEE